MKRWVLEGTDYVYPRTTNRVLEAYLNSKGVAAADISINYTPFGHSDWQTRVAAIKRFGSAGKKTAVVSTINGDANVPFYKELGNQKVSAEDIPVVAFSVGEEELSGLDTKPLVGHLAAWNYFQSISTPANTAFIKQWKAYIKKANRTTNDPMEAHYIGFNLWVKAVEKAKSVDIEKVLAALPGLEDAEPHRRHRQACCRTITSPSRSTSARSAPTVSSTWSGRRPHGARRRLVRLPAGQPRDRSRLGDAEVRQLQHQDEGVLGTELQVTGWCSGGRQLSWLLLALALLPRAAPARWRNRRRRLPRRRSIELKDASFLDKEAIIDRVSPAGHHECAAGADGAARGSSLRPRTGSAPSSSSPTADERLPAIELIDPATLQPAGSAAPAELAEGRHQQPSPALPAHHARALRALQSPTRRCASPRSGRWCARSTSRRSSC